MSYKTKPQIKLYAFQNNAFVLQAIIDDFQEVSFERNLYQAGTFTITINYNIPNSQLFQRGLFVQFGNDPYDFGEIITINDSIGADGKGSQIRTITGYDARYILKRRVIKNMNSNGLWVMTAKGELCLRNLIKDQCGSSAESKRQLPIINTIPASADAIGKEYSVSEQFTNLYEVCKTIATQSEIGWRLAFDGTSLTLECYQGTDRSQTVQFSTSFDSLADGQFTDSSESFSNAIYVGGKGQNDDRDIYEGENGSPSGLDRFESWDNQSSMTTESEYEAEALSMLTQYGQTIQMSGNGLAKCPYIYKEQYDVGDLITVAFSGKSAVVQILSVTEHWAWGSYDIEFSFGKPQNNLSEQLQLMLRKIQSASEKSQATDSVRWYTLPADSSMPKADVTYNTIGFTGSVGSGKTFTLYLDDEKTGSKTYHVYFKQLAGSGKLTLTTGVSGASNLVLNSGTYVTIIYVDENGNITSQGMTPTSTIESGNNRPAESGAVNTALEQEIENRNSAISNAINSLDVASVGGSGKYISAISETDGKISATASDISDVMLAKQEYLYNGNVDDLTTRGIYSIALASGLPSGSYGTLIVYQGGYSYWIQVYYTTTGLVYTRYKNEGSAWSSWQRIINIQELQSFNLLPYRSGKVPNVNIYHYIDADGYILANPINTDPRNWDYANTETKFMLANGNYTLKIEGTNITSQFRTVLKDENETVYLDQNTSGEFNFTINDTKGYVNIGLIAKLYSNKIRFKLYKQGAYSFFSWYSNIPS